MSEGQFRYDSLLAKRIAELFDTHQGAVLKVTEGIEVGMGSVLRSEFKKAQGAGGYAQVRPRLDFTNTLNWLAMAYPAMDRVKRPLLTPLIEGIRTCLQAEQSRDDHDAWVDVMAQHTNVGPMFFTQNQLG